MRYSMLYSFGCILIGVHFCPVKEWAVTISCALTAITLAIYSSKEN